MHYASVCSGIGAPEAAWSRLGWTCAFASEIEPFARAVYAHHYPDVPLHGDFTRIDHERIGAIDLLVAGTPCQSFSVAGLRGGMDDERGNLALEYLKLADRLRPRWLVWENVPGVLSSNGGRDFGSVIGGMVELGYGVAYRVLDAQFFGVPQRRRRVFVVGYLGDWRRASAVLFERASLSGNPAPSRATGQGLAGALTGGAGTERIGRPGTESQLVASPLAAHHRRDDLDNQTYVAFDCQRDGQGAVEDIAPTLAAKACESKPGGSMAIAFTVTADSPTGGGQHQCVAFQQNSRHEVRLIGGDGKTVGALAAEPGMQQQNFVAQPLRSNNRNNSNPSTEASMHIMQGSQVRRLTPRECERLQGFPDDYTLVAYRKKPAADGPRYRALGNSMAVPVLEWIGKRIEAVNEL